MRYPFMANIPSVTRWLTAKFGGMDVSEAKRLRALEEENAKLKKLLAEQMLDAAALRELPSEKW
jgi:putative transposase